MLRKRDESFDAYKVRRLQSNLVAKSAGVLIWASSEIVIAADGENRRRISKTYIKERDGAIGKVYITSKQRRDMNRGVSV